MPTWRAEITYTMRENRGETWADVVKCTLDDAGLDEKFDDSFGGSKGKPFTVWTAETVYFPIQYDGAEWAGWAPRHPCDIAVKHQGR